MNQSLEREEVLKPCLALCKKLEISGTILQWRRLDVFDKRFILGSPDIEIWIPHGDVVLIFMCECKRPDGGVQSEVQSEYEAKYKIYRNVQYQLIRSPEELHYFIKKLSLDQIDMEAWSKEVDEHMEQTPILEKGQDI